MRLPPPIAATILRYLHDFTDNAAGLTAWGLLFLVVTALLMIHTVDRVLNRRLPVREDTAMRVVTAAEHGNAPCAVQVRRCARRRSCRTSGSWRC